MKSIFICILLLVLLQGCISPEVKTGDPSGYELPGLYNTTVLYLNLSSNQVIDNVINRTSVDYVIEDSIQTFRNPVAVDYSGNNVTTNVSIRNTLGKNYAHMEFGTNFSGFVAYTRPGGQDFTYRPAGNNTIQIVLPENFTSATMFIGYISPKPDNITNDSSGREVLIWKSPESKRIRVRYHHRDTPEMLMYLFGAIFICAVIVWLYFQITLSSLSKKRMLLEKDIRK